MRWLLHAFLQGLLNPVHGNVVFSRSKLHALHKSLVFFRSLLLPAVANLMFCVFFCMFCTSVCDSVLMCCSLWQAVPESSWYFNAILRCFLRAVYGNVVFFYGGCWQVCDVLMQFYRVCWKPFMGMSYFLVQKCTHVTKVSCLSTHFPFVLAPWGFARLCKAFGGIGSLWEALGWFGRVWKALQALRDFVAIRKDCKNAYTSHLIFRKPCKNAYKKSAALTNSGCG